MVTQQPINLSLEELADEVALCLQHYHLLGNTPDSRVSPVPDSRTIRYYTTLGLLERPMMEGRQARYNKRHLLQVIAVKALQARGLPLSEVQARIYGLSNNELEALLAGLVEEHPAEGQGDLRPVMWKEVVIEPGFKLMVEDGFCSTLSEADLELRVRAALKVLNAQKKSNGGRR